MRTVREQLRRVAEVEFRVRIEGPSGSGKGVAARLIHEASRRHHALQDALAQGCSGGDVGRILCEVFVGACRMLTSVELRLEEVEAEVD